MLFNPLKVEELDKFKTKHTITYYVNATTGSDDNDGLTANTAFKTIQHAVDILPKWLEHAVKIQLAPGTYGKVTISGFHGNVFGSSSTAHHGRIAIQGASSKNSGAEDNYVVNGVQIGTNSPMIILIGFTATPAITAGTIGKAAVAINGNAYAEFSNVKAVGTSESAEGEAGFSFSQSGRAYMTYCGAYNVEIGVGVVRMGMVGIAAMHGSGVGTGYKTDQSGIIQVSHAWGTSNTYTATTMYNSNNSGLIVDKSGELV